MERIGLIIGGVVLLIVLAGGAYMGARLLAQRPQTGGAGGLGGAGIVVAGGSARTQRFSIDTQPARGGMGAHWVP